MTPFISCEKNQLTSEDIMIGFDKKPLKEAVNP
jgi:hypothetical protein